MSGVAESCSNGSDPEPVVDTAARAELAAGHDAWNTARPDIAESHYLRAETLARESGDTECLAHALSARGLYLYERCEEAEALALHDEAIRVHPGDHPEFLIRCNHKAVLCLIDLGRLDVADERLGASPPDIDDFQIQIAWHLYRLQLAERTGDLQAVLSYASDLLDMWPQTPTDEETSTLSTAIIVALSARAILGDDEEFAGLRAELLELQKRDLSLNLRCNLAKLHAELAFQDGRTEEALGHLEDTIGQFIDVHANLPSDLVMTTIDMLQTADRRDEAFDHVDRLFRGELTSGEAALADAPPSTADLLAKLIDLPGFADRAPAIWRIIRRRGLELTAHPGVRPDPRWQLCEALARSVEPPRSRLLMAKLACEVVQSSRASDLVFPAARRRHAEARLRPFRTALGILYDMGRLSEARAVHDRMTDLLHAPGLPSRQAYRDEGLLTEAESAVAQRLADEGAIDAFIDGSIWPSEPDATAPARPASGGATELRLAHMEQGWVVDFRGPEGGRQQRVAASTARLTEAVHATLASREAGRRDGNAEDFLRRVLLEPVRDLLPRDRPVAVSATGCLSALSFDLLSSRQETRWIYRRGWADALQDGRSSFRRAALLHDGLVDVSSEIAALESGAEVSRHPVSLAGFEAALATGADVVHLAGHFETRGWDPFRSGLLAADGAILSVHQIEAILERLPSPPLVCLGLCETAGVLSSGRGEVDLPGLFIDKGSRFVIATAWRISDAEAGAFARRFYPELLRTRDPVGAFFGNGPETAPFMLFTEGSG